MTVECASPLQSLDRRSVLVGAAALGFMPGAALGKEAQVTNWIKQTTEPYKGKQDDIYFVDAMTGWYGNGEGKLYHTSDGGQIWSRIWTQPGTFIRALGFVDGKHGYLGNVGTDYYPGVTDKNPLYETRDGGKSWTAIKADGIESVAGICGIDILKRRGIYQGELTDQVIIHAAGRVGGPAKMIRSVDSGGSWAVKDLSGVAGMILDVKFFDDRTGFVCAATNADLEQGNASILRTLDGGESWQTVYQSKRKFETSWKMSWPSRKVGYATVQNYNPDPTVTQRIIIKTVDGGKSWSEVPLVSDPKVREFGLGFADEKRGFVGTNIGGFETRDGGKSWSRCEFGKAVNKVRVVKKPGGGAALFAIGVDVHRLDLG
jgi:photosystem II stability/assembly factor-like uncharacterized protein